MWLILEHRRARRQLESLPLQARKRYEKWKAIVGRSGPQGLRELAGLRDEALRGQWKGHRSSRLNIRYRIIYKVVKDKVTIEVVEATAHDYRRK